MKKPMLIAVLLALVACGAYVGPLLFAQQPNANTAPPTKVAVVNIRAVVKQNARAKALQAELEESLKPHKLKAKQLSDAVDALTKNNRFAEAVQKKAEWEAVNAKILRLIEETHKDKMPAVWNEINGYIDAVAKAYGFQIVLGYGDPDDPDVNAFQSVKGSKLRSADMGCTVMTYSHGSVDITGTVITGTVIETLKRENRK